MKKEAIIVDLDNTIYPVAGKGSVYLAPVLQLIDESGEYKGDFAEIRSDIMRRPFMSVAENYSFSEKLKDDCLRLLSESSLKEDIKPYEDYRFLSEIPCRKFLVTAGLKGIQESKIKLLNIEKDFEKIYIIDILNSRLTKKDIFRTILSDNDLKTQNVIVVGDDQDSEIKAAAELGIDAVIYTKKSDMTEIAEDKVISNFKDLVKFL